MTKTLILRTVIVAVGDGFFVRGEIFVPLARCLGPKKHRVRVLPRDVLPRKLYTVQAQTIVVADYIQAIRGTDGLRTVVGRVIGHAPHFTALWGWLGGLGCWALGRGRRGPASMFSAVLEETQRRVVVGLVEYAWAPPASVPSWRSQSKILERRKARLNELEAAVRVLRVADGVVNAAQDKAANGTGGIFAIAKAAKDKVLRPLAAWVFLMFTLSNVLRIGWWARSTNTAVQRCSASASQLPCPSRSTRKKEEMPCTKNPRGPPTAPRK